MASNYKYAGIGSRKCPAYRCRSLTAIALYLHNLGFILRSGGADGPDKAFEAGAGNLKEIFRPRHATKEAVDIAMSLHPKPEKCNHNVRLLHGRNVQIILGKHLDDPVEFVLCYTPGAKLIGGTAMGIRVAKKYNIDIYNLFDLNTIDKLYERFDKHEWTGI